MDGDGDGDGVGVGVGVGDGGLREIHKSGQQREAYLFATTLKICAAKFSVSFPRSSWSEKSLRIRISTVLVHDCRRVLCDFDDVLC